MGYLIVLAVSLIILSIVTIFVLNFVLCNAVVLLAALFENSYSRGDIYGVGLSFVISLFHTSIQILLWIPILKILFVLKSSILISFIIGICNFLLSLTLGIICSRLGAVSEQNEKLHFLNIPLHLILWIATRRGHSKKLEAKGLLEPEYDDETEYNLSSSWWTPKTVAKPSLATYFDAKLQKFYHTHALKAGTTEVN